MDKEFRNTLQLTKDFLNTSTKNIIDVMILTNFSEFLKRLKIYEAEKGNVEWDIVDISFSVKLRKKEYKRI